MQLRPNLENSRPNSIFTWYFPKMIVTPMWVENCLQRTLPLLLAAPLTKQLRLSPLRYANITCFWRLESELHCTSYRLKPALPNETITTSLSSRRVLSTLSKDTDRLREEHVDMWKRRKKLVRHAYLVAQGPTTDEMTEVPVCGMWRERKAKLLVNELWIDWKW